MTISSFYSARGLENCSAGLSSKPLHIRRTVTWNSSQVGFPAAMGLTSLVTREGIIWVYLYLFYKLHQSTNLSSSICSILSNKIIWYSLPSKNYTEITLHFHTHQLKLAKILIVDHNSVHEMELSGRDRKW